MVNADRPIYRASFLPRSRKFNHRRRWSLLAATVVAALAFAASSGIAAAQMKTLSKAVGDPAVDVVSSTTETSVFSFTIPANTIGANGWLRLTLNADIFNNTGGARNFRVRLYFGGTATIDTGNQPVGYSANRRAQTYVYWLTNLGATNSQLVQLQGSFPGDSANGATSSGSDPPNLVYGQYSGLAVDTTSAQNLQVTVQLDTNSPSFEWRQFASLLEFAP